MARVNTHLTIRRLQQRLAEQNSQLATLNARMKRDLEAAAEVQQSLLPQTLPQVDGARFAWVYRPCDELGGDSLNVFQLGPRHVGLYALDVCGHGVSAALLSVALTHALVPRWDSSSIVIKSDAGLHEDLAIAPTEVASHLNRMFPMSLEAGLFATILYAVIDLAGGILRFVSAGHPGLVLSRQGEPPLIYESGGLPIGIAEEAVYEEKTILLQQGDRLFLYSDGLLEEPDSSGELFGKERLLDMLTTHRSMPLNDSVHLLEQEVLAWSGKEYLQDDLSILAVEIQELSQTESVKLRGL